MQNPRTSSASASPLTEIAELDRETRLLTYRRAIALLQNPDATLRDIKLVVGLVQKFKDQELRARLMALRENGGARSQKQPSTPEPQPKAPAPADSTSDSSDQKQSTLPARALATPSPGTATADPDPERFMNRKERRRLRHHPNAR